MNKKIITLFIILIITIATPLFSQLKPSLRYQAMGEAGVALADTPSSFQINPASLYVQDAPLFSFNMVAQEAIVDRSTLNATDPIPTMQHPITLIEFLFASRYSALLVGFGFDLTDRAILGESLTYTSYNDSFIQLNVAYGFSAFSIGLYARSGSRMKRPLITIDKNSAILDYIAQVYLNRYAPSNEGQLFNTGLGLLISYPFISLGLLTDSLFTLDEDTSELVLDFTTLLQNTKVGLAFHSNEFDVNNELNRFVFTSAFDITHLLDDDLRSLHMGFELKLQLLKDLTIALQTGYKENRGLPNTLFGFDWDGTTSYGLGAQINSLFVDISLLVPTLWYTTSSPVEPITLLLSAHYQF
ncbi:MAG: hypothetical protein EOM67_02615 [Spirochaetia bacterium]|nr:hypothetical protein [Spirochaetia bacterium]